MFHVFLLCINPKWWLWPVHYLSGRFGYLSGSLFIFIPSKLNALLDNAKAKTSDNAVGKSFEFFVDLSKLAENRIIYTKRNCKLQFRSLVDAFIYTWRSWWSYNCAYVHWAEW